MGKTYVVKNKIKISDTKYRYLNAREIIDEKIAYDVLALCGVNVPETFILEQHKADGRIQLSLAYEHSEDLVEPLPYISSTNNNNSYTLNDSFLNNQAIEKDLQQFPIEGLFESLAAFALILDYEGIGVDFKNARFLITNDKAKFIKLNPSHIMLTKRRFQEEIADKTVNDYENHLNTNLAEHLISDLFEAKVDGINPINTLSEVFRHATREQKLAGITIISKIKLKDIKNIVYNKGYSKYVGKNHLNEIIDTLWERVKAMAKVYQSEIQTDKLEVAPKIHPQQKTIIPYKYFLKTTRVVDEFHKAKIYHDMRGEIPNSYFDAATTPMHAAIARQDNTMISDFIDNKSADTALRDSKGDTPLHRASELNYQRIVMTLYNKGARKSKSHKNPRETLLHNIAPWADRAFFNKVVNDTHLNPSAPNTQNMTPREIASKHKNQAITEWYQLGYSSYELSKLLKKCEFFLHFIVQRFLHTYDKSPKSVLEAIEATLMHNKDYSSVPELNHRSYLVDMIEIKKGDLEPLKSLVTDINTEITERTKNDKIIYENSYYEKRFEELIIEAIHAEQFYNLSCDIDNMLAKFFNKRSINESNSYAKHFFRQAYDYGRIPDSLKQALTGSREMFSGIHRSKYIALIKILETRIDCQHYTVEQPFYTLVGAISATIRDLKIQQGKTTCCQFRAKDDDLVSLLENILRKHLLNKHEECRNSYDAFVTKFSQEDIYNGNDAVNAAVLNQ